MKPFYINIATRGLLCLLSCVVLTPKSFAADDDFDSIDDNMIAVYGNACEKIRGDEPKSSARVRVTDKASFVAVSDIPDLMDAKKKLGDHDFNVVVYGIVDNMIEDMAVRTIQQDASNICVEVTGFISKDNVLKSVESSLSNDEKPELKEIKKPIELIDLDNPVLTEKNEPKETEAVSAAQVFITPTEFYNNTKSVKYAEILKQQFSQNPALELVENEADAKYIIRSKILRAKVESINSNTNRLQMVVAVELSSPHQKVSVTEHQNKFVLFSETENEQDVAYDLMKKLLNKAGEPIMAKVSSLEDKSFGKLPSVITPTPKN